LTATHDSIRWSDDLLFWRLSTGDAVKVVRNIRVTDEARDWLLRHYMDADADDPLQLRFIPTLACSLATYDGLGKKIRGPAYDLYKGDPAN
jgi:hypothetical protein